MNVTFNIFNSFDAGSPLVATSLSTCGIFTRRPIGLLLEDKKATELRLCHLCVYRVTCVVANHGRTLKEGGVTGYRSPCAPVIYTCSDSWTDPLAAKFVYFMRSVNTLGVTEI